MKIEVLETTAANCQRNFGHYQDAAIQGKHVIVTRNGRESCTLLSTAEYNKLKTLVSEITKKNRHGAVETGAPVGGEVW